MTTTIATILNRALDYSVQSNASDLYSNTSAVIDLVASFERDIFRVAAANNRYFIGTASLTSTSGSSARTVDLSATAIGRVITARLPAGTLMAEVDVEDPDAELAPRYYVLGTTMTEVTSDWGASGTVAIALVYAKAPVALDPTAGTGQTVTLDDQFCDLLWIRLAKYFAEKDTGRDPAEAQAVDALYQARLMDALNAMQHYGGVVRRRFLSPFVFPGGSE